MQDSLALPELKLHKRCYLHPKYYIKDVKTPFLNFVGYMKNQFLSEFLLSQNRTCKIFSKIDGELPLN